MKFLTRFSRQPRRRHAVEVQSSELRQARLAVSYSGHPEGGDCHEVVRVSANRVLFAVFDVAGRRKHNATAVAAVLNEFRSSGANLFAADDVNEAESMMELCRRLNRAILAAARRVCACPAFVGCFNENLGTVCYFNSGHTPALFAHESGVTELPATGLPLGLFSHSAPDAPMIALQPTSVLVVVSRGVVEASRRGQEFSLDRVKETLRREAPASRSAGDLSSALLKEVGEFTHNRPIRNDMTVLALERAATTRAAAV